MPLNEPQNEWLDRLGAAGPAITRDAEVRAARAEVRENLARVLKPEVLDNIRTTLEGVTLVQQPDGIISSIRAFFGDQETMSILDAGGDPMKEFDTEADAALKDQLSEEDYQNFVKTVGELTRISMMMREMKTAKGDPLFADDASFAEEFWQPLVREGIIPENFVPGKYSEVERTMTGAGALYEARLQEYSKNLTLPGKFLEYMDLPVAVASGVLKTASAAMKMEAGIKAFGADVIKIEDCKDAKEIADRADIIEGVATCLTSVKKAADQAIEKKDLDKASDAFVAGIGALLKPIVGSEMTSFVTGIATCVSKGVPIGKALAEGKISDALAMIGDAIEGELKAAGTVDPMCEDIGVGINAGFQLMAGAAKTVEAARSGNTGEALTAALGALNKGVAKAGEIAASKAKERALEEAEDDEAKKRVKDYFKAVDNLNEKGSDMLGEAIELPEALKGIREKAEQGADKDRLKRLEAEEQLRQERALEDLLTGSDPRFEAMLAFGFGEAETTEDGKVITDEMRLASIETLMAEVQRADKIYSLSKTIVTGGAAVVTKFIPGVGIAKVGLEMMFAMGEAYQKGKQLSIWMQNVEDASSAHTVQLHAMRNRYKLQNQQTIMARAEIALKAIELVGEAMKLAGHFAPIGYAISAGAAGLSATKDIMEKCYSANEMRNAWNTYKAAIAAPKNRKLAREALEQNPTLAKYAMAWGAVEDGNPVAQEAMRRCGLNDKTLAHPGTNVDKVVKYLELVYKDDPKLLRSIPPKEDWFPGPVELTFKSWRAFHKSALADARPKLDPGGDVSGIVAGLHAHDVKRAEFVLADGETRADMDKAKAAAEVTDRLFGALRRYKPKVEGGSSDHAQMSSYVDALAVQAENCLAEYRAREEAIQRQLAEASK